MATFNDLGQSDIRISFGNLTKGMKYPLKKAERTVSKFGDGKIVEGIKVTICDEDGVEFITYLPKAFSNMTDDQISQISTSFASKTPASIVLYGTVGLANMAKIHAFNEAVDEAYLAKVTKLALLSEPRGSTSSSSSMEN
ncbi:Metabotropic glutamate receptor-like protein Q [Frankliniella fusca]|uniref:Metabotropic glutamate receptor-like protein Q n=1 Tax=Frankliniella fusca TaxID=407009 RepID=A0AAE1LG50_9NEOP|nr:Metabotropic glutamate receptor-like protein Q [Frankliniella fusca]